MNDSVGRNTTAALQRAITDDPYRFMPSNYATDVNWAEVVKFVLEYQHDK